MKYLHRYFLQRAHFRTAILESAGLSILFGMIFLFFRKPDTINLAGLALELGIVVPVYLATRARSFSGWRVQQALAEGLVSIGLASLQAGLFAGLIASFELTSSLRNFWIASSLACFLLAGCSYLATRVGLRLWFSWRARCRQSMAWALAYDQLGLVATAVIGIIALVVVAGVADAFFLGQLQVDNLLPVFSRGLDKVILTVVGIVILSFPVLLVMLGVFSLFSYQFARRTTRRLEDLARAAEALRLKDYSRRVEVEGEDEVAHLQASFNQMAGDLAQAVGALSEERDRVKGLLDERRELFANVSHELRTPLAVLRSAQEALVGRPELSRNPRLAHDLQVMDHQIERLQAQLDDLFTLSQAEVGRLAVACTTVDLEALASSLVGQFAPLAWRSSKVEVLYQSQDAPLVVWADAARLEQALANLLRNALQYTPPGGVVLVETRRQGQQALLQVRDTGCGIEPEDLAHIWSRYVRAKAQPPGGQNLNAGLGLSLVKELVKAMDGSVLVESQAGEGSSFSIFLRLAA